MPNPAADSSSFTAPSIHLRRYVWTMAAFWTMAVAIVLIWELRDDQNQVFEIAHSQAVGVWKKEAAVYKWIANTGGVYVPVTDQTVPDEALKNVADRDVTTTSGQHLTLLGTPTILRRLHAIAFGPASLRGHVTSLHPVRPENQPDAWEREALKSFQEGAPEAYREELVDGTHYMRLMRPLRSEKSCMRCHVEQKYKEGDLRGGLSVAVPMDTVWSVLSIGTLHRIAGYGGMWLLGLLGIALMSRRLQQQITQRDKAEQRLKEAHDLLEQRVAERTAELAEVNQSLESEIIDRRKAEQWLLESEQRFRGYFEQGLVGMAILTAQGDWDEVNLRLCRMLGYTEEELRLKTWPELASAKDRPTIEQEMRNILCGITRNLAADSHLVRKDGRTVPVGLSAQCLQKADGTVDCILVLVQDMTRHRTA